MPGSAAQGPEEPEGQEERQQRQRRQQIAAEAIGTAALLGVVVGSGIMAERLAGGSVGLALLCNALATGAGLVALLLTLGPVSGAHLNPAVTLVMLAEGQIAAGRASWFIAAQVIGAMAGTGLADMMFGLPPWTMSDHARTGAAQWLSEAVATGGLVTVVLSVSRRNPAAAPFAVAGWIVAAYWWTPSTSFANPAVTLARAFTDTFAGIRLSDVPGFVVAQILGAALATALCRWLIPPERG